MGSEELSRAPILDWYELLLPASSEVEKGERADEEGSTREEKNDATGTTEECVTGAISDDKGAMDDNRAISLLLETRMLEAARLLETTSLKDGGRLDTTMLLEGRPLDTMTLLGRVLL